MIGLSAALRLAARELRSGELTILVAALIIAVASSTTVSLLSDRLNRTMSLQAAEFIAADLVVSGHDPAPPDWVAKSQASGLRHAQTVEFPSVLMAGDEILLAGIKAVSPGYPLRGHLKTRGSEPASEEGTETIPEAGQVWVEPRVLTSLGLAIGDSVEVGEKRLRIERIIVSEPDPRGDLYSLAPRVLMHIDDLPATRIIQPGSHVHRYELFSGAESDVLGFKRWLSPQLHPGQRIIDVHEDRPEVGNALKRAQQYLGLTTIGVILIAGCAIAMSVRRYTERHYDLTAMLKCFGLSSRSILGLYALQFLAIGVAASAVGCGLGWLLQQVAAWLLRDLLPQNLVGPSPSALLMGLLTGLLILFGFALPPVLRLRRCTPLRVLRRDLEPTPSSAWTIYGTACGVLGLLLWRSTGDARLTVIVIAGGLGALLALGAAAALLLRLADVGSTRFGVSWRFAMRNLSHNRAGAVAQTLAFGVTFIAMLLTLLVRTELLDEWRKQLPQDAPNHFALNLFAADVPRLSNLLTAEGLRASEFYPIVRGRLTAINGVDVRQRSITDATADSALNRDLSLTWAADMPPQNTIAAGTWWQQGEQGQVSVERQLANGLGLQLGDRLTFDIAGMRQEAVVTSFRVVRWDTMMPNFFMIFSPGALERHPHTFLTSFFIPPERKVILGQLAKSFPNISLLDVDRLLIQFQTILTQISGAIEYVLVFALAAGFTVLLAAVRASLDARLYVDAVCRALGAPRKVITRSLWIEFCSLGLIAGLLAALAADGIAWVLFDRVFHLEPHIHPWFWLATPVIAAAAIGAAGYANTRPFLDKTPLSVMREL
jgi:putative ABC transport system permease protein